MLKVSAKSSWRSALPRSIDVGGGDVELPEDASPKGSLSSSGRWRNRFATIEALAFLISAKFLVRYIQLGTWRSTLGDLVSAEEPAPPAELAPADSARVETNIEAGRLARSVFRASQRIPGHTKCLPQAVALQWMLKRRSITSSLVIAAIKAPTEASKVGVIDPFHAWVERDEVMIIGRCDREMYQAIMTLSQGKPASSRSRNDTV